MSKIKLKHSSGNSMSIGAPATNPASDLELKLPATVGSANEILKNSGTAGTLEYADGLTYDGNDLTLQSQYFYIKAPDGGNRYFFGETQNDKSAQLSLYNSSDQQKVRIAAGDGSSDGVTFFNAGRVGIGTTSPGSQINTYSSGSDGLQCTTPDYSGYVWQIQSSGNLFNGSLAGELGIRGQSGIGFSANSGSSAQFRIESDGDLVGADTSISSISDSRVKKNVTDYTYDLAKFKQLTPKTFDWINPDEHFRDTNVRGFLAQDVKTIDDYWVKETDSVNKLDKELIGEGKALSSKLGSTDTMYVSVIKQLIAKIETLETKVAALEAA